MVGLFLRFRFRKKALDCSLLVTFLMVIDVDAITFEASNEWGGGEGREVHLWKTGVDVAFLRRHHGDPLYCFLLLLFLLPTIKWD